MTQSLDAAEMNALRQLVLDTLPTVYARLIVTTTPDTWEHLAAAAATVYDLAQHHTGSSRAAGLSTTTPYPYNESHGGPA